MAYISKNNMTKVVEKIKNDYAKKEGAYPDLIAGNMVNPNASPSTVEFTTTSPIKESGTSITDGTATIKQILGNTAVHNQLVSPSNNNTVTSSGGKIKVTDGYVTSGSTSEAAIKGTFYGKNIVMNQLSPASVTAVSPTWSDVATSVRAGTAPTLYPVGTEFTYHDTVRNIDDILVVRGFNTIKSASDATANTMILSHKYVYGTSGSAYAGVQFDAYEAAFYCTTALAAGTYKFTWNYATGSLIVDTVYFTTTQTVPAGGQIVIATNSSSTAIASCKVSTYGSVGSTTALDSNLSLTSGSSGTNLGTIGANSVTESLSGVKLNIAQRILWGSNNYAQSAVRQFLNSSNSSTGFWLAQTMFDRAPSWNSSYTGFYAGLPSALQNVILTATVPCRTNSYFEVNSLDNTTFTTNSVYNLNDKIFLLSRPEMYGTYDSDTIRDGEQVEYYDSNAGLVNTDRIQYDRNNTARNLWLRSPYPWNGTSVRIVNSASGALDGSSALDGRGVSPACIIG